MTLVEPSSRIGVISDTHGFLHPRVFELFEGVDLILHAGDVEDDAILEELAAIAPVLAISGNVDLPPKARRPLSRQLETAAGRIAMIHGHMQEAAAARPETLVEYFRKFAPAIIIHGHTHIAALKVVAGVTIFNPGSAGRARFGSKTPPSVGMITAREGLQPRIEHLSLATGRALSEGDPP